MKKNQNNCKKGEYYIGLDIGTNSVGFAATTKDYNLLRFAGKSIWGVRLFEEGNTAVDRRTNRTNRRRLARRNKRLELLRTIFDEEITKIDNGFFMRLKESFLNLEDKTNGVKYSLFADKNFTDKDYMKKYPTIYHLRNELATSNEPHDVRLVYLAIRHIIKNRGHFLFDVDSENNQSFDTVFMNFIENLKEIKEIELSVNEKKAYEIITKKASKADRVKALVALCDIQSKEEKKAVEKLFSLIVGGTAKMADIFGKDVCDKSLCFDMGDEKMLEIADEIGDGFDLIYSAKAIYDSLILEKITKGYNSISEYKKAEYEQHKKDIKALKAFVKGVLKNDELYKEIFKAKKANLQNYCAYSGYRKGDKECHATQVDFCKYLKSRLPKEYENDPCYSWIYERINEGVFAPKLRKTENGVIPNSLHRSELVSILDNASKYLGFLLENDSEGVTVKDKIIAIFDFRVPYYVGPLKGGWAQKNEDGTVYPWNFDKKVNLEASAEKFITQMTSICTYTGEDVLPKNSLLYSEFEVLNEINNIKVNGAPIDVNTKKLIYNELFVLSNKKVTKKTIKGCLRQNGLAEETDEISGVDDTIKSSLASYHKLKNIIAKTSYDEAEEIIRRIVLFGDDKKLLRKYLEKQTKLEEDDIKYVLKLKFKDWGRLSKEFLTKIESINRATGEVLSIIGMLRETNLNLMQILSDKFEFKSLAEEYRKEKLDIKDTPREMVEALYVSPKIRRSIWQTLRIIDEIVDVEKGAPDKIFIEVARENEDAGTKAKNEASRKPRREQLIAWYKECKQNSGELFRSLENETDEHLRSKKLYLYYLQFGKCMYSGEPINIAELDNNFKWDIDHIFPRSKIKDDSFDNLVLVKAELNREKTNIYPIKAEIRENMYGFWSELKRRGTVSQKKFERLVRRTPLTEDELAQFVNRQLVETRQSTKAVAELLKVIYPNTKIVYSKANNVSDFRKEFDFIKCREINDHHHAKDAYLNVVVGNYFDTRFTSNFMRNILNEEYSLNPEVLYKFNVKGAWQKGDEGTIQTVRKVMAKNNVLFTVMPREEHGQLYKVTILKKQEDLIPIKQNLKSEKYGGYGSAKGAYFAVVEYTKNGKKVRTIEAVLSYKKAEYEKNPELFARNNWYPDSKVIVEKILAFSPIEIDGVKYTIRGRKPGRIIYSHLHQFIMCEEHTKYIKKITKWIESNGKELTKKDELEFTTEKNLALYDYFIERIHGSIYEQIIPNVSEFLEKNRSVFENMKKEEQLKFIKEVLKAFKCDATIPAFISNAITKNKVISGNKTVYLINQSVTGLFEKKVDLLK